MNLFTCNLRDPLISTLPNANDEPFEGLSVTKREKARGDLALNESASPITGHMSGIFHCSRNS
jgi:hypothetical protein